jgi:hypothetical protein
MIATIRMHQDFVQPPKRLNRQLRRVQTELAMQPAQGLLEHHGNRPSRGRTIHREARALDVLIALVLIVKTVIVLLSVLP